MIRHSVIFKFKSQISSEEKQVFFKACDKLTAISGVQNFEILRQISPKNRFEYGILMEFENMDHYDYYTNHPDHLYFVENHWLKSVEDFLEIDYKPML
ncbi:Stress responsive A/B Barrel Domain [Pseudarcicella hirudinis]|uniref:Stress responsive A/B Barrel Domain n=1 Tax=Pseudarcicella hirudinis TaxID=1079859 RepID=A0A1I5SNV4_9BACT|nr:Dabb family protein [Pseudarcicella hirudinis]SFP72474.1 Stress responsive A/B Barrel Domain [Pseudarcicella hirudinis]